MAEIPNSPRFESDKEDGEGEKKQKKIVAKTLEDALKSGPAEGVGGVDVDPRMMEGRKANRGFTMSVGSAAKAPDIVRSEKRAQTLPAVGSRRGDIVLDEVAVKKMEDAQKNFAGTFQAWLGQCGFLSYQRR
jgi:hypothetical protein